MKNMEIDLAIQLTLRIKDLRVLCRDRKISPRITAKKGDLEKALRAWEEVRRTQAQLAEKITPDNGDEEDGRGLFDMKVYNDSVASTVIQGVPPPLDVRKAPRQ
ncbi:hypothetical protein NDU88_003442 [Pleurodeles waltl]|uniref:Uncharacterized protein n=1 Tax=Pleurodeles waltl TaxID=8319 RepID=A0AAV7MU95_PLEWA|nr:hypothetical protein NDU88_003442 [Pleurodeles waltl]